MSLLTEMERGTDARPAFVHELVLGGLVGGGAEDSAVQPRPRAAGMVSTEVDDTWEQLRAARGGESAGNGKPVTSRFCGRPEHSRSFCRENARCQLG